jgi:DNA-binding MurR/RpiR family transcriptional regulator
LLKALLGAELDNVELTFERNDAALLSDAIRRIEDAKRVLVLGQRSCFPIAFFFTYVYRLFRTNSVLLQNQLGSVIDDLRDIGPRDLLIAISIAPYAAETIQAVEYARERRARIVAITDDPLSPIARAADVVLPVAVGTPSFFHSTTAIMALAQALLALLVARGGAPALAALDLSEKQLARFNAYWHPTPARPTPPRPLSTRGKPS